MVLTDIESVTISVAGIYVAIMVQKIYIIIETLISRVFAVLITRV